MANPLTRVAPAAPADATAHFASRLAFETDVVDTAHALEHHPESFALLDVRGAASYTYAHAAGALSAPTGDIEEGLLAGIGAPLLVVYCWGPGCNGAHNAAERIARLGFPVKEMIGGFEYWVREGFGVEGAGVGRGDGRYARDASGLVALPAGQPSGAVR